MKGSGIRNGTLCALAAMLVCGCGEKERAKPVAQGALAITLSMLFQRGSTCYKGAERWAELVEEKSGGRIKIRIYPGGELLAEKGGDQLGLLGSGDVDMAVVRPSELSYLNPSLEVLYLPFLFPNRRSAHAVLDSAAGKRLLEGLEKGGIVGLGYFSGPFLQLSSTNRVVVPKDLAGLRVRLPRSRSSRVDSEAMKLLGVENIDMPLGDLRISFAEGRLDGQVSTLGLYNRLDLEKWQKHLTMLNYSFEPMIICASSAFWSRMSGEQREMLLSTLQEAVRYQRGLLMEEEHLAKKKAYEKSVSVVDLIPEELDLFRKVVEKKYAAMAPGTEQKLISEVIKVADESRAPYLYRFYDNLASAIVTGPPYSSEAFPAEKLPVKAEGSVLAHIGGAYSFDERYGIFCPVPSRLEYDVLIPPNPKLEFGIGVRPGAHEQFKSGVTFTIDIKGESGSEFQRVFEKTLDPFVNEDERQWVDELLDLDFPAGKRATIVFSAESAWQEESTEEMYYGAIWTNPVLYEGDEDTYRRNIILISLDTLRADALGCYGNRHEASPNIDRMAGGGTMFLNCISQNTWTLPSQMSIMTSLYPGQHTMIGAYWDRQRGLDSGYLTLAEVLRDNGYNTIAFTENGWLDSIFGYNQGFNSYSNFWQTMKRKKEGAVRDKDIAVEPLAFRDNVDLSQMFGDFVRTTHITFSKAMQWIENSAGRKFFCFIHTYETHLPYFENPYVRLFSARYTGMVPDELTWGKLEELSRKSTTDSGEVKISERDLKHLWALYSAQARFVDDFIGKLLDALKKAGLDRDTLVVLTSDHGERFYSHGSTIGHGGPPYEEVIRVPLIMRCASAVPRGREVTGQVALLDILPTVLQFAGCRRPSTIEGVSLYPSIVGEEPPPEERPIYMEDINIAGEDRYGWNIGLRFKGKKFIYYPFTGHRELFDLSSDPGELENIADESEETQKLESMVRGFIRRRPYGYYLVFTGDDMDRTFEGELAVEGVIRRVSFMGGELEVRKDPPLLKVRFKTRVTGPGEHVLNLAVDPEDARLTLDLKVDGERNPAWIFPAGSSTHPEALPWELDDSIRTAQNPYAFTGSKVPGCYVSRIESPYLADNVSRGGLRVARSATAGLEEPIGAGSGAVTTEEEVERAERVRERLKALGYIQ